MNEALELERRSSAVTLSDMEIFVFPELMYAITLANILSPRIWRWREDPWFAGVQKMKPYRRIVRLKQYIMDHYAFNLDLDTWGLTTKPAEIERFRDFIDVEAIRQANALFGYEGDQYYFDIDIRTHFGLDKYGGDVIPYWKTETVEAMDAFRHKPGYQSGAGECVSLSALYAAALFVVARIPLERIWLMATPLHSQNFVEVDEGILTNNRRLVTKAMWFNGTAISAQARRALENERVTVVAHSSGYIHTVYDEATIDPKAYARFVGSLRSFLHADLSKDLLGSFLRHSRDIQKCFQFRSPLPGRDGYLPAERAFAYEESGSYLVTDRTRDKLFGEIDMEEFECSPLPGRIVVNELEEFVAGSKIDLANPADVRRLKDQFAYDCLNADRAIEALIRFCHTEPRLPVATARRFAPEAVPLGLDAGMDRERILARLTEIRGRHRVADLALYAYRDLARTEAEPFVRAAIRRNPVSIQALRETGDAGLADAVRGLADESIYDGAGRLAQPDEAWNYRRGDGVEKALLLANVALQRHPELEAVVGIGAESVSVSAGALSAEFPTSKGLGPREWRIRSDGMLAR